jgi:MFS family permease
MHRSRWHILLLLGTAELLGMSLWFTASAVAPHFRAVWDLTPGQTAWLTTAVQLGFVGGTALAAASNLADVIDSRVYFATAAVLAAIANAALVIAPTYHVALILRFATGLLLAGVYPPAMKMIATWFQSGRGLAIGTIVGALTMGKATPYLLSAFPSLDARAVILLASCAAAFGGVLVATGYRDGPYPFARRAFSWGLVPLVFRHRETRLAIGGYLGHMWELYAMWSALSLFFISYFTLHGRAPAVATAWSGAAAFGAIAIGAFGSVVAGVYADRIGRERTAIIAMVVSAACAMTIGWLVTLAPIIVVGLALVWGFAVVADSAQFSALVTEVAPPHAVGTALTLQTSLGFLLTAFTIWLTVQLHGRYGWGVAFTVLGFGPLCGIPPMLKLQRLRAK